MLAYSFRIDFGSDLGNPVVTFIRTNLSVFIVMSSMCCEALEPNRAVKSLLSTTTNSVEYFQLLLALVTLNQHVPTACTFAD